MHTKTTVTAKPNDPILKVTRQFNTSPAALFRVFSEKEFIEKWWNPFGKAIVHELKFIEGGMWKFSTGGEEDVTFHGFYHEITPSKRIIHTSEFDNLQQFTGDRGKAALSKYEFEPVDGGTKLTLTELYMSADDLQMAVDNNMEKGIIASYETIDSLVEELNR